MLRTLVSTSVSPRPAVLWIALLASLLALPCERARADLLLNEVLYDPAGADEGREFVELWNPDSSAVPLAGVLVEAGDGARPGAWTTVYIGGASDSVLPRRAFVIRGTALLGTLQNGPDAIRLTRAGIVLDLLGYGALTAPDLFEGSPAEDAPSGAGLARIEDGRDTGSNAADWASETEPSPGLPNHPDARLTLGKASALLEPEVPWPGEEAVLRVVVRNRGRREVGGSRWQAEIATRGGRDAGAPADSGWTMAPRAIAPGVTLTPGESTEVRCAIAPPAPGRFDLRVSLRDSGSAEDADTLWIRSRSTAAPLVVDEIAFRDRGAGEWVELVARERVPDLGAFSLSDATGRAYPIDRGPLPRALRAGERIVVAQSPALLLASYLLPDSAVAACRGGWASLNDSDREDGIADRVRVVDSSGVVCDAVPYRSEYTERRASIERLGTSLPSASRSSWAESIDPRGGTPGRANSLTAPGGGGPASASLFVAGSRVVRRASGEASVPVVLAFGEASRGKRMRVLVHDLLGRVRRRLVDGQRVLGESAFVWDGRDDLGQPMPAGIYVVRAETIPEGGEPARSGSLALTVVDQWGR